MRNKETPETFYNVIILGVGVLLLAALILSQVLEYRAHLRQEHGALKAKAQKDAEYIKISMENLIMVAGSGAVHLDEYVEALNRQDFLHVRTVHSESLNRQFSYDAKEQPEHELESRALLDGRPYDWETEDFFVNVLPMVVDRSCQGCHLSPEDPGRPVPVGYTLALVEIKAPTAEWKETREAIKDQAVRVIGFEAMLVLLFMLSSHYAGAALKRMAVRSRLILEKALEGFLMLDARGVILNCNDAFAGMLGYSVAELKGRDVRGICGKRDGDGITMPLAGEDIAGRIHEVDAYRAGDGRILDVETSVSVLELGGERIIYSFLRDITAQKKAQRELLDAHKGLEGANAELLNLNQHLEERVEEKSREVERINVLKQFFSPQLVESLSSGQSEDVMRSHRRVVTIVFLDLRGFTRFVNDNGADEVMAVLREYHHAVGPVIFEYGATIERFTGDGIMVFLGDPVPRPDHAAQAVRMAIRLRAVVGALARAWRGRGHDLALGIGISTGEATLGRIGYEKRVDYAAIGTVTNMAARLCAEAPPWYILVSPDTLGEVGPDFMVTRFADLEMKGFVGPVVAYSVEDE